MTFLAVHFGWVIFRAPTFERATDIYLGMLGLRGAEDLLAMNIVSATFGRLPYIVDVAGGVEVALSLSLGF